MLELPKISHLVATVFCLTVSACIVPPQPTSEPSDTYKAVALVRQGQELARSGRAKRAEGYFREALLFEPNSDSILNDIGYSLLSQQRFDESSKFFLRAIKLNPDNQSARLNLARSYYLSGQLEGAAETFHQILEQQEKSSLLVQSKSPNNKDSEVSKHKIYRNLAVVYYAMGFLDDAICYSSKAFQLSSSMEETAQHSRMLLSLDRLGSAIQLLQNTIAVHRDKVPANLMYDYGLALITVGNYGLAEEALSRALKKQGLSSEDKLNVRNLKLLIDESRRQGVGQASQLVVEYPDPGSNSLCGTRVETETRGLEYWPESFFETNKELIKNLCSATRLSDRISAVS